jgi:hypothetical protein
MEEYKAFCEQSRPPLRMDLVTDNLLQHEFGISQHRMAVRFLIQDHMEATQEPFFLKRWCTRVRANMLNIEAWSTRDFVTVLMQLAIIGVLPIATSFPSFVSEYVYVSTSAIHIDNRIPLHDFFARPWSILLYNSDQVNLQNLLLVWLSCVFYAVMLIDLLLVIVLDPLEDKHMFAFRPRQVVLWEKGHCCKTFKVWLVFHYLATAFAMVYFASIFGYAVMVSVWFVLGACIRPEVYLAYAAAASSLITFALAKIHEFKTLQDTLRKSVFDMATKELESLLGNQKAIDLEGDVDKFLHGDLHNLSITSAFTSAAYQQLLDVSTAKVRDVVDQFLDPQALQLIGVSIQTLAKLHAGDDSAIIELASSWGVDAEIVRLLLSVTRMNVPAMLAQLRAVCKRADIDISEELIVALFEFVKATLSSSAGASKRAEQLAAIQAELKISASRMFNALVSSSKLEQRLQQELGGTAKVEFASLREYIAFFSSMFDTVVSLMQGDISPFYKLLEELGGKAPLQALALLNATETAHATEALGPFLQQLERTAREQSQELCIVLSRFITSVTQQFAVQFPDKALTLRDVRGMLTHFFRNWHPGFTTFVETDGDMHIPIKVLCQAFHLIDLIGAFSAKQEPTKDLRQKIQSILQNTPELGLVVHALNLLRTVTSAAAVGVGSLISEFNVSAWGPAIQQLSASLLKFDSSLIESVLATSHPESIITRRDRGGSKDKVKDKDNRISPFDVLCDEIGFDNKTLMKLAIAIKLNAFDYLCELVQKDEFDELCRRLDIDRRSWAGLLTICQRAHAHVSFDSVMDLAKAKKVPKTHHRNVEAIARILTTDFEHCLPMTVAAIIDPFVQAEKNDKILVLATWHLLPVYEHSYVLETSETQNAVYALGLHFFRMRATRDDAVACS